MKFLAVLFNTFFYSGYLPVPGTSSSLIVLLLSVQFISFNPSFLWIWLVLILILFFMGVWISTYGVREIFKNPDPSYIVIDEVVGMMIALIPLFLIIKEGEKWLWGFFAFLSFRLFDIWKPWLISQAERLKGGWGIMIDDLLAGLTAAFLTWQGYRLKEILF